MYLSDKIKKVHRKSAGGHSRADKADGGDSNAAEEETETQEDIRWECPLDFVALSLNKPKRPAWIFFNPEGCLRHKLIL